MCELVNESAKCVLASSDPDAQRLLSDTSSQRLRALAEELGSAVLSAEGLDESSYPLIQWVLLGAAAEAALQVFLTVYIQDYRGTRWQQWESFREETVMRPMDDALGALVESGEVTGKVRESLRGAIRRKIREHTNERQIEKVTLDELIKFYDSQNVIARRNYTDVLRTIQRNRNCIHAYMDREVGSPQAFKECLIQFGRMLEDLIMQLPDLDAMLWPGASL